VSLHIHAPETVWVRRIFRCPVCGHRGRIVGMVQMWYDTTWTCCSCGDSWTGGELLPRPFARGWRKRAVEHARARWIAASSRAAVRSWLMEQLGTATTAEVQRHQHERRPS